MRRILALAANPTSTPWLRLDEEIREIEAALRMSRGRDQFQIDKALAVTSRSLVQELLDFEPQIVHFCGHGQNGGLVLEDPIGAAALASSQALASLFESFSHSVRCVVLNACYSKQQAEAISQHIDYVIGMKRETGDRAAIEFAYGFYQAIGAKRSIPSAFKMGCNAVDLSNLSAELSPVILERPASQPDGPAPPNSPTSFASMDSMSRQEIMQLLGQFKREVALEETDGDSHHNLGLVYLQLKLHDAAVRHFERALELDPANSDAHYYLAVSMVRGRQPKSLLHREVKPIESQLEAALQINDRPAKYFYFLGLLRQDYYIANGMASPQPDPEKLFRTALSKHYDALEIERLLRCLTVRDERLVSLLRKEQPQP